MKQVDEGATPPAKLLFYLEEFFGLEATNQAETGFYDQISYLENHEGNWKIGFTGLPSKPIFLSILTLFETKLNFDGIEEIVFFYQSSQASSVKRVAGCLETEDGIKRAINLYFALVNKQILLSSVSDSPETRDLTYVKAGDLLRYTSEGQNITFTQGKVYEVTKVEDGKFWLMGDPVNNRPSREIGSIISDNHPSWQYATY